MASPIEAVMLLCDAAVTDGSGKIHMLGAGWSVTGSPTAPSAVAVMLKIPWDRTNKAVPCTLELQDADGRPVQLDQVGGSKTGIRLEQTIEVGRPPGLPAGTPIDAAFQVGVPSLPLPAGRYTWHLTTAENVHQVSFLVRGSTPL